jgi:hypothetical protein
MKLLSDYPLLFYMSINNKRHTTLVVILTLLLKACQSPQKYEVKNSNFAHFDFERKTQKPISSLSRRLIFHP